MAAAKTGWYFAPFPDLSRETRRAIGKAKAGWTLTVICTELHQAGRKGTAASKAAAAKDQRLGIGLKALARESGQSVPKVRKDVRFLEDVGLVVTTRPKVVCRFDTATGRIVENRLGRCQATLIYLTITKAVLRPDKASKAAPAAKAIGNNSNPTLVANREHPVTTVREEKQQRTPPDGDACGIGTPPGGEEGGLTAAKAGRLPAAGTGGHSAAKAGHEERPILPVNAGRDAPDVPDRILPPPPKPVAPPRRRTTDQAVFDPPRRSSAQACADWQKRDPKMDEMRTAYLAAKAARAAKASTAPPDADKAAERLREAVETIPDDRRDLIHRDVKRQADEEAVQLRNIVERRRQEDVAAVS